MDWAFIYRSFNTSILFWIVSVKDIRFIILALYFYRSESRMSILFEFIPSIFVALAFDFILYISGAGVLRIVSFGLLKYQMHSYGEFKEQKAKSNKGFIMPYIVGLLFYALLIASIAWLN